MNLFYQPNIPQGDLFLDEEESKHCVRVLRKTMGDSIRITDGKGKFYNATITHADSRKCAFQIEEIIEEASKCFSIHIAISPTKNADRLEWFVEKAVEFGIDEITPLLCKHTERSYLKQERLEKVAISAMKQSLKSRLPIIHGLTSFIELLTNIQAQSKFIAYVDTANPDLLKNIVQPCKDYVVLIGPEGDFSSEELEQAMALNFKKVSLGTSRLRTETAGMAACHILNLVNS